MPLRGSKTTTVEAKQPAAAAEAAADVAAPKAQTAEQPAAPEAPAEEEVAVGGAAGETPIAALAALLDLGHEGLCNLLSNHQAARFALLAALDSCAPVGPRAPGPHEQAVQRVLAAVPEPTDEIDIFYLDYVARRVDRAAEPLCYWGWRSAATGDDGDDRAAPVSLRAGAGVGGLIEEGGPRDGRAARSGYPLQPMVPPTAPPLRYPPSRALAGAGGRGGPVFRPVRRGGSVCVGPGVGPGAGLRDKPTPPCLAERPPKLPPTLPPPPSPPCSRRRRARCRCWSAAWACG